MFILVYSSRGGRVSATERRAQVGHGQVHDRQCRSRDADWNYLVPAGVLFARERGGQGESAVRGYRRIAYRSLPADL